MKKRPGLAPLFKKKKFKALTPRLIEVLGTIKIEQN